MKKYFLYFLGLNLIAFAVVLNVLQIPAHLTTHSAKS